MLTTTDLNVRYGSSLVAEDINIEIGRGDFVGLVGASGAGKSTVGRSLVGLGGDATGSILFDGTELVDASKETLRKIRGSEIAIVFQDAAQALHPTYTIGEQIAESIDGRRRAWKRRCGDTIDRLLEDVELPSEIAHRYPHELSGGQSQRALLAVSLAGGPKLLVADEPTTGLDTITQSRILDVLESLSRERTLSILLITHDLDIVAETCERTLVMREGVIVDSGETETLLADPSHPYTRKLIASRPTARDQFTFSNPHDGTMAELKNVSKRYGPSGLRRLLQRSADGTDALTTVSLAVQTGESVAIIGRSGAGKTTIARLIAGLETPTTGTVRVDGESVGPITDRTPETKAAIGYVFQSPRESLDPRRRIASSIAEPLRSAGLGPEARKQRVNQLLRDVGLVGYETRYPRELSGGEAQRVGLARALATDPDLLILDEATSALDTLATGNVCDLVDQLRHDRDLTLITVTHDIRIVKRLAERVIVLEDGSIVDTGPTEECFAHPSSEHTGAIRDAAPTF